MHLIIKELIIFIWPQKHQGKSDKMVTASVTSVNNRNGIRPWLNNG